MRKVERKIFKRFALSFLIVLVLPVTVFVFFFLDIYQSYFQSKMKEQAQTTLEATARELDRQIEGLRAIVEYDSLLSFMQPYMIARDITGVDITTMLISEESVHAILDSVCYYSVIRPDRIYTSKGSYSPMYYAKLVMNGQKSSEILERWKEVRDEGWILWETDSKAGNENAMLQYVISNKENEWWVFTVSLEELQSILGAKDSVTRLLRDQEELFQLSAEQFPEEEEAYFEITAESEYGYFQLSRQTLEKSLFQEIESLQQRFIILTIVLLFVGFLLVLLLTFYNEHPIRQLQGVFRERVQNIPEHVHGLDVFRFSLDDMEKQLDILKRKQTKERLMLQLLFGSNCTNKEFHNALTAASVFQKSKCFSTVAAVLEKEEYKDKIGFYMEMLAGKELEFYIFDSFYGNAVVILFGILEGAEEKLDKALKKVAEVMNGNLHAGVVFCVGNGYSKLEEICQSYREATLCSLEADTKKDDAVLYYKEKQQKEPMLQYPAEELRMLYDALTDIDFKKASMLTDVLLKILENNSNNRFISSSLYYDVLNTYYRARAKLEADADYISLDLNLINMYDGQDAAKMISNIREQYQLFIDSINEGKKKKNIIPEVLEFIDNYSAVCDLTVSMIADNFDVSISNLSHQFKAQMDCTISDYITEKKFLYACKLLAETDYNVQEIAERVGYSQTNSFIRKFRQIYGITPLEYRNARK